MHSEVLAACIILWPVKEGTPAYLQYERGEAIAWAWALRSGTVHLNRKTVCHGLRVSESHIWQNTVEEAIQSTWLHKLGRILERTRLEDGTGTWIESFEEVHCGKRAGGKYSKPGLDRFDRNFARCGLFRLGLG